MAGIAALKAHLVLQQAVSKTWNSGRHITGSAIYSTHAGDSAVITATIESYTLFLSPKVDLLLIYTPIEGLTLCTSVAKQR